CSDALRSCGKLCSDLHEEIRTLQSGVTHSNKVTSAALGSLSSSVSALNKALENLQSAQG
ncbi:mobilization protein, partial [Aeromonas salmonicida]